MKFLVVFSLLLMSSFAYAGNGGERGGEQWVAYGTKVVCHAYSPDLAGVAVCNDHDGCDPLLICQEINNTGGVLDKAEVPATGSSDTAN